MPANMMIAEVGFKEKVRGSSRATAVGAPIPGAVTIIAVERGSPVKKGDKLLVMEAMKMQTTVSAPVAGKVLRLAVQPGQTVEPKDLLVEIGGPE